MARGANQKLKLPLLERALFRETDEEHPMTVQQLISTLEAHQVGAERKSIYDDMDALRELGLDVQSRKGKSPGWFIGGRLFELAELKLLVDAVQSCKFITRRKSDALIHKLESLTSRHQARFEYNVRKEKVYRREGKRYQVSPYGLIWDNENYYLAGYDHLHREMRHYRVDKMAELAVTCLPRLGDDSCRDFDLSTYAQKHFGMFSGREAQVTLRCRTQLVGVVLDRFGQDVILVPDGDDHFTVTVRAVVSPQFLGWLFGLGSGAELLSPDWAVEAFRDQLHSVEDSLAPPRPAEAMGL